MKKIKITALMLVIAILSGVLSGCNKSDSSNKSNSSSGDYSKGSIVIAEVMSQNENTITDANGKSPDYITIFNPTSSSVKLKDYYLSDKGDSKKLWKFPDIEIQSGEYLAVFADGSGTADTVNNAYYTNFSISADGESIYLSSSDGSSISEVNVPTLPADIAYGMVFDGETAGQYEYFEKGSPLSKNTSKHSLKLEDVYSEPSYKIILNEYMTSNKSKVKNNYGVFCDWIELYNADSVAVDLSGMFLSDNPEKASKWKIPDGVKIEANGYLIIWLDDISEFKDGNVHGEFKLGKDDKSVLLTTSNGITVFNTEIEYLQDDVSKGIVDGKWAYFGEPTPNAKNTSSASPSAAEACSLKSRALWISEVSAFSGVKGTENYDWIELHNGSGADINLKGYGIGRKAENEPEYTFSNVTIKSGGYILIYAAGNELSSKKSGSIYLPFKISYDGEKLFLFNSEGKICDFFESGKLAVGNTCGRSGTVNSVVYYDTPTPFAVNSKKIYAGYSVQPVLSNAGGYAKKGDVISCKVPENTTVYFTKDGTKPTTASPVFTEFTIGDNNIALRFLACTKGCLPSEVSCATYIVTEKHDIPMVSIVCDPDDLYSNSKGILAYGNNYASEFPYVGANFWQDWEREISFEYYLSDGKKELSYLAGTKVSGQYTRAYSQKALAVYMRGKYGTGEVTYPFFEGNEVTTFEALVLRAGGQDQQKLRFRDAFCAEVLQTCSDVPVMDWQPVALYINGKYSGCYSLREKINEGYFEQHEGIDPDNLTFLKGDYIELEGTNNEYLKLLNWIGSHDLRVAENYKYVEERLDVDNYIEYLIAEIFFCNTDTGNIKFYQNKDGGKWKWVVYDMDMSLTVTAINTGYNSFAKLFNPEGHGTDNMFPSTIHRKLMQNPTFRDKFIKRYAELLNTAFMPQNLTKILDDMVTKVDNEMKLHGESTSGPTYAVWTANIKDIKSIINKRRNIAKSQMISYLKLSKTEVAKLFPNG